MERRAPTHQLAVAVASLAIVVAVAMLTVIHGPGTGPSGRAPSARLGGPSSGVTALEQPTGSARGSTAAVTLPGLRRSRASRAAVAAPERPASARGRLVAGYPAGTVPVPPGSTVRSSSITAQDGRVQGTVVGGFRGSTADLERFYHRRLRSEGLTGTESVAVGGSRTTTFSDGSSTVTLTCVGTARGHVRFSLFLVLLAVR
jgi:hypothetical protein